MTDDLPREFRSARKVITDKMAEATDEQRAKKLDKRIASRYASEMKNPCLKESDLSMKCMSNKGYDRDQCSVPFQNYRNCLDFWSRVQKDRRGKGIKPYLPLPEHREEIRKEYWAKWLGSLS